jgi:branched-chain amino acid aminotransferase
MDFSKLNGKIYFKNKFINNQNANIHVLSHSLHFATAIFEGIGVYKGKPLFLKEHLKRLYNSANLMKLNIDKSIQQLENISRKLVKINNIKNGYIRPIIFRSSHSMSPETKSCKTVVCIASWEWSKLFSKAKGISLNLSKYPRLNNKIYPIEAKSSGSYQTSVISRIDSYKKKFDDCLMLDLKKNIAESSACNIFWIKKNVIYTPSEHSILNGITRKSVIKICKKFKIKVKVGNYKINHIIKAENVFLTGTAAEIQTVRRVNRTKFPKDNNLLKFIKNKYDIIKKKCPNEIKGIEKLY